jgi:hypothetical protein
MKWVAPVRHAISGLNLLPWNQRKKPDLLKMFYILVGIDDYFIDREQKKPSLELYLIKMKIKL